MLTPARRHRLRVASAKESEATAAGMAQNGDAYEFMRAALTEDRRRLSDIQSIQSKVELKNTLLENYQPYVDGVLESGNGAKDDVVSTLMIWHVDCGEIASALKIAAYVLKHDMAAPDNYERTSATIIAEEVADYYLRKSASQELIGDDILLINSAVAMTTGHDMPDQVRAKLLKAQGLALRDSESFEPALEALKKALELDVKAGVKAEINKLEKQLNISKPFWKP